MQVVDKQITTADANTGTTIRAALNNIFDALNTQNSGATEPTNPEAFMPWVDTSNSTYYYLKQRNHDNTAWNTVLRYTVATKIIELVNNGTDLTTLLGGKISKVTTTDNCIMRADGTTGNVQPSAVFIDDSNNVIGNSFLVNGAGGIGFTTGAGGSAIQPTGKNATVTLNKYTGLITLNNASLAAGAAVSFLFYNSNITSTSEVTVNTKAGTYATLNSYDVKAENISNGFCYITVKNNTAGALSEALGINFSVTVGATA